MLNSEVMRSRGFTLVELIMIVLVIGAISAVAFLSLNPYKVVKLDAAAKKVAADLKYTRNLALSMAKWYGINFEVDPVNTYTVYETDGAADTVIENPSQLGRTFVVDLYDYYSGVKISSVDIGGGNKVEFHPLGAPYTDKTGSAITAEGTITVEYAGISKTIKITPNTGKVSVP